jgi:hypothetical protein
MAALRLAGRVVWLRALADLRRTSFRLASFSRETLRFGNRKVDRSDSIFGAVGFACDWSASD